MSKFKRDKSPKYKPRKVEELFDSAPDYPHSDGIVDVRTIPHAARTAVEFIHDEQPHAVLAADRGGRPLAIASMMSWSHRYPNHRFPSIDGKIHFSRFSGKTLWLGDYFDLVKNSMVRAGVMSEQGEEPVLQDMSEARVTLIDDWIYQGKSAGMFVAALESLGVNPDKVSIITMCNGPKEDFRNIVNPAFGVWERSAWKDNSEAIGVSFRSDEITPYPDVSATSLRQRQEIRSNVENYYDRFDAALEAGKVVACACKPVRVVS